MFVVDPPHDDGLTKPQLEPLSWISLIERRESRAMYVYMHLFIYTITLSLEDPEGGLRLLNLKPNPKATT